MVLHISFIFFLFISVQRCAHPWFSAAPAFLQLNEVRLFRPWLGAKYVVCVCVYVYLCVRTVLQRTCLFSSFLILFIADSESWMHFENRFELRVPLFHIYMRNQPIHVYVNDTSIIRAEWETANVTNAKWLANISKQNKETINFLSQYSVWTSDSDNSIQAGTVSRFYVDWDIGFTTKSILKVFIHRSLLLI